MIGSFSLTKLFAGLSAAAAGGAVVTEVVTRTERIILGVPQSWFLAAVVGALIGVVLLKDIDAGRISPAATGALAVRWSTLLVRVASLGIFVLCYAMLASWIVYGASIYVTSLKEGGVVFSGLSGVTIRPMLPHYLKLLQQFTDRKIGRGDAA